MFISNEMYLTHRALHENAMGAFKTSKTWLMHISLHSVNKKRSNAGWQIIK